MSKFDGFEDVDFDFFSGRRKEREGGSKKKIVNLMQSLESRLQDRIADLPSIDPIKLQAGIGEKFYYGKFPDKFCWCYVSQEKKDDLAQHAHFTIIINKKGLELWVNMEADNPIKNFIQNVEKQLKDFLKILQKITGEKYELKIWERVETKQPAPAWPERYVCSFNIRDINEKYLRLLIDKLKDLKYSAIRLVRPYSRGEEILYSSGLVDSIIDEIKKLQDYYSFARR